MNLEKKEDPQQKQSSENENKIENKLELVRETFIKLEGTHTTSTDTDEFGIVNSILSIPETSQRLRQELINSNANPSNVIVTIENNTTADANSCQQVEFLKKPVKELLKEMNENIQAILDIFTESYVEKDNETAKLDKTVESYRLESNKVKTCEPFVPKSNDVILDIEPTQQNDTLDESYRVLENGLKSLRAEPSTNFIEMNQNQEIENIGSSCAKPAESNSKDIIVPLKFGDCSIVNSTQMAPCESTYHTLHIHAASSPSSSVMFRAPMCTRFWAIITDFFTAICLCLQVNRDCIFCLGFFITFVVSASFLTAFFYRTLSVEPQTYRNQKYQHQLEGQYFEVFSRRPGYFY